jgi:uncharacterized membrane protein YdjX (TVP38/TMEM64 family)
LKTIFIRMKSHRRAKKTLQQRAQQKEDLLGILILAAIFALFVLLTAALCRPVAGMLSDPGRLRLTVLQQGVLGLLMFFGLEVFQGFLPIPLEVTAVAAGYIFGPLGGFLLTIGSAAVSTTLIFTLAKMFGERFFLLLFPHGQKPWILRNEKARRFATWIVFLIPGLPKRMFIFSAALVPQKFSNFLAVCTLARIPSLLVCSFGGHALGNGDYMRAAVFLCAVAVPAVLAVLIYRAATAQKE